jgi:hypothetical protein
MLSATARLRRIVVGRQPEAKPQYTQKAVIKIQNRPPQAHTLPPEPISGGGDPRSMVPVRQAGTEVTAGFCTKLAGCSDAFPFAERLNGMRLDLAVAGSANHAHR